jgi:dihydrofolate synthase/folylpolyglutamate synthase
VSSGSLSLSVLESRGHWGIKKGLDNIRKLLVGLGHPETSYPAVLIAGTNGKGSTGAFLAHSLQSAGLNIGWTTSPHLLCPSERIWINGQHVSKNDLDALLEQVLCAEMALGIKATYFELMVSASLLAFEQASVDLALVEVGMGGRWDSTNILDPIITILTNVAMDHTAHLGDTLEAIAAEKLCTARDNRPLVLGPALEPQWLKPLCESKPLMLTSCLPDAEIFWDHSVVNGYQINLAGNHQIHNLATALGAIDALRGLGWKLDADRVYCGLSNTKWPGRFWKVPGLSNVVFDGAHNVNGAEALAGHLNRCGVRPHLFFSAMSDKDLFGMAMALAAARPLSVTIVEGEEYRYADVETMRSAWSHAGCECPSLLTMNGLSSVLQKNVSDTYLVTGSLYFLGHLLEELNIFI